jgi:tRNA threonylcarbamoyladenosine biosynthesis protein TsaE
MQKVLLRELGAYAKKVLENIPQTSTAVIVALSGELGAGKTTFVQALAKELGIKNIVQSPTYVLMKQYDISYKQFLKLIHIDAYRLETPEQFSALRPETFLNDPHSLVVVEWPERVKNMLPEPHMTIKFSSDQAGEGERYIEVV